MLNEKQRKFIQSLGIELDFGKLTDDDLVGIEDVVAKKLQQSGFDAAGEITPIGKMCESILDELA